MENMNSDEYSSVKDFFEELILNPLLFERKVPKMTESELIPFYDYVVRRLGEGPSENHDFLWRVAIQLEEMPIVDTYKKSKGSVVPNLTPEECQEIDATVQYLESKRKMNPVKKLFRYLKG